MVVLAVAVLVVAAGLVAWVRYRHRDEVFVGITPGLVPAAGQQVGRARLRPADRPVVAVRFTPPDGVSPGLAGTVVDNTVNGVDVSATLVDLAIRGWFRIRPLHTEQRRATGEPGRAGTASDWELVRRPDPEADQLSPAEQVLVQGLFTLGDTVTLSAVRAEHGEILRRAVVALYRETVDRGWFSEHPRSRPKGWLAAGIIVGLVGLGLSIGPVLTGSWETASVGVALLVAGVALAIGTWLPTPTTAEGSAVRFQALGFKQYLATAEAGQLATDAAADIYSKYLPYAMVFGVVGHWNKVFADVVRRAHDTGVPVYYDFGWIVLDGLTDALILSGSLVDLTSLSGGGLLDLDLGGMLEGLTDGAGDFAGSVGDLLGGLGDGCDLTDGCGCDF